MPISHQNNALAYSIEGQRDTVYVAKKGARIRTASVSFVYKSEIWSLSIRYNL
jgi:hypothetical protein